MQRTNIQSSPNIAWFDLVVEEPWRELRVSAAKSAIRASYRISPLRH